MTSRSPARCAPRSPASLDSGWLSARGRFCLPCPDGGGRDRDDGRRSGCGHRAPPPRQRSRARRSPWGRRPRRHGVPHRGDHPFDGAARRVARSRRVLRPERFPHHGPASPGAHRDVGRQALGLLPAARPAAPARVGRVPRGALRVRGHRALPGEPGARVRHLRALLLHEHELPARSRHGRDPAPVVAGCRRAVLRSLAARRDPVPHPGS